MLKMTKRGRRTLQDRIIDKLLLIYQTHDALPYVRSLGETKLQKLTFLSELEMLKEANKGFNYSFIKLDYGPFSSQLRADLGTFIQQEILVEKIRPRETFTFIIEDFDEIYQRNNSFIQKIEKINKIYAPIPTNKLVDKVHRMYHPYLRPQRTIGSLSPKTPIIYPIRECDATRTFHVTPGELADLEMSFDKKISTSIDKAMKDAQTKHLLSHEEVFGSL